MAGRSLIRASRIRPLTVPPLPIRQAGSQAGGAYLGAVGCSTLSGSCRTIVPPACQAATGQPVAGRRHHHALRVDLAVRRCLLIGLPEPA